MDKQQVIAFIERQLATGIITAADLSNILTGSGQVMQAPPGAAPREENSKNLIHTFYGIGAVIALIGVGILVAQNWNEIGFGGRVVVTLGISLATYVLALIMRSPEKKTLSQVLFTISAALAPLGAYVLLEEASVDLSWSTQLLTATILAVVYGVALFISRRSILVLITIAFASWAYYALLFKVFENGWDDMLKWATMLLGASYVLIAYGYGKSQPDALEDKEGRSVRNMLYGLGTLAILGGGIMIGEIFDLFYIALLFGAFYGSVYLKSGAMLILGAFFLMAHLIKLTSEYFVDSIGWPVSLIVMGFLVIGVGYMTFSLNKRFLSR